MLGKVERGAYNLYRAALRSRSNPVPVLPGASIPASEATTRTEVSPLRRKAAAVVTVAAIFGAGFGVAEVQHRAELEATYEEAVDDFEEANESEDWASVSLHMAKESGDPEAVEKYEAVVKHYQERASTANGELHAISEVRDD